MHVSDQALVDSNSDQRGGDAFGDRRYVVPHSGAIRIEISVENEFAMAHDLHAVDRNLPVTRKVKHFYQWHGIDPDLLRRRRVPPLARC